MARKKREKTRGERLEAAPVAPQSAPAEATPVEPEPATAEATPVEPQSAPAEATPVEPAPEPYDAERAADRLLASVTSIERGTVRVSCGRPALEVAARRANDEGRLLALYLDPDRFPAVEPDTFTPLLDAYLRGERFPAMVMPSPASVRHLCFERDADALPVYLAWLRRLNQRNLALFIPLAASLACPIDELVGTLASQLAHGCCVVIDVDEGDIGPQPWTLDLATQTPSAAPATPSLDDLERLSDKALTLLAMHAVSPAPLPHAFLAPLLGADTLAGLSEAAPWVRLNEARGTSVWADPLTRRCFRERYPERVEAAARALREAVLAQLRLSEPTALPPLESLFLWLAQERDQARRLAVLDGTAALEAHIEGLRSEGALHRCLPVARAWTRFLATAEADVGADDARLLDAAARAALTRARVEADAARLHEAQRQLGEAARRFSRLFSDGGATAGLRVLAETWHRRARLLLELDEPDAAATLAAGALQWLGRHDVDTPELGYEVAGLHRCHGLALHDKKLSAEGRRALESALGLLNHFKPTSLVGLTAWCQRVAQAHSDLASVTSALGLHNEERGHYTSAKQRLREALGIDDDPATRLELALVLYAQGCAEDALDASDRAQRRFEEGEGFLTSLITRGHGLDLRDLLADVMSRLASMALTEDRFDDALSYLQRENDLRRALVDDEGGSRIPALANALNDSGVVLLRAGRTDEAAQRFADALEVFLTVPEASRDLDWRADVAAIHGNRGKALGAGEEALRSFERALDLYAGMNAAEADKRRTVRAFVLLSRAEAHLKSGNLQNAHDDFEACQRLHESAEQSTEPVALPERLDVVLARLEVLRRLRQRETVVAGYDNATDLFERLSPAEQPSLLRRMTRLHDAVGEYALDAGDAPLAVRALTHAARGWRVTTSGSLPHLHREARVSLLLARAIAQTDAPLQRALDACEEALLRFREVEHEPACAVDHAETFCEWAERHLESGHVDVATATCGHVFARLEGVEGPEAAALRARAFVLRGKCHAVEGLTIEASDDFRAALAEATGAGTPTAEPLGRTAAILLALLTESQNAALATGQEPLATFARGRLLEVHGRAAEGLEAYGSAITRLHDDASRRCHPWADLPHLLRYRAGLLAQSNDIPRAMQDCESALAIISRVPATERGPSWSLEEARLLGLRAGLHLRRSAVGDALTDMRAALTACARSKAVTARGERVDLLALQAEAHHAAGDASAALRSWDEAEALITAASNETSARTVRVLHAWSRLAAVAATLQATGRAAQARARAFEALDDTLVDANDDEVATVFMERAQARAKEGYLEGALQDCEHAAAHGASWRERDPLRWGRLLALRGRVQGQCGAHARSLADLEAALGVWKHVNPTLSERATLRSNLGLALLLAGRDEAALSEAKAACALLQEANAQGEGTTGAHPLIAIALHNLARVQAQTGNLEAARQTLSAAIPLQRAGVGRDRPERLEPLAIMLHDRAVILAQLALTPDALTDLDAAIDLHRRLRGAEGAMGLDEAESRLYRACLSPSRPGEDDVLDDLSASLLTLRRLSARDVRAREVLAAVLPALGRLLLPPTDAGATALA